MCLTGSVGEIMLDRHHVSLLSEKTISHSDEVMLAEKSRRGNNFKMITMTTMIEQMLLVTMITIPDSATFSMITTVK